MAIPSGFSVDDTAIGAVRAPAGIWNLLTSTRTSRVIAAAEFNTGCGTWYYHGLISASENADTESGCVVGHQAKAEFSRSVFYVLDRGWLSSIASVHIQVFISAGNVAAGISGELAVLRLSQYILAQSDNMKLLRE